MKKASIPQVDGAYSEDEGEASKDDSSTSHSHSADQINHDNDHNCARLLLTNARSLLPKEDALVDAFQSLELHFAGIVETWFKGGKALRERLDDLEDSKGIKIIHKSRDGRKKAAGGGVAFAFNKSTCNFKGRNLAHASRDQEIVCAVGKVGKLQRLVVVFVVYVPPSINNAGIDSLRDTLSNEIASVKASIKDPVVIVCGDFNRRDISSELATVGDLLPLEAGPTRGNAELDIIYTNEKRAVKDLKVLPPLQSVQGVDSDHRCVFAELGFKKEKNFSWVVKMRRQRTQAREEAFAKDLAEWDWDVLRGTDNVDSMVAEFERVVGSLTERHFPLVRVRRRSNEDPWITRAIRRLWKKKIRHYKKGGKNEQWWTTDHKLQDAISTAKQEYVEKLLQEGTNGRSFYAATKRLASATSARPWSVTDLFVGLKPAEVCREILGFYGSVSTAESPPLPDVPRVPGDMGHFSLERTTKILRESKKTDSAVAGDPLPHLIRGYPTEFAVPVMEIFNRINDSGKWPTNWKTEYLTVIPKVPNPSGLHECRNISCTAALSKILEGQVLAKLKEELAPDPSQYGGIKKCGAEHMLLDLWEDILTSMEGGKTAAVLLGVDYEKAFNRMEHAVCLEQLQRLGASPGSISLVKAFLEGRKMTIIIDGHKADPVAIKRGSPQGSVLGCLLYCITTQLLTRNLRGTEGPGSDSPGAYLYVDDTTLFDVERTDQAIVHLTTATPKAKFEHLGLEEDMKELKRRAEAINMKINVKKTQLLVISPPNGYQTTAVMKQDDGGNIDSIDTLKLVGFTFGSRPGAAAHLEAVRDKIRRRMWMVYNLREAGFKGRVLYRLYCCFLRSIIEYCSVVYHPMLTLEQEGELERLHNLALKVCFGFDRPSDQIKAEQGIESLAARRRRRFDVFLRRAVSNPRFSERWFPAREGVRTGLRRTRMVREARSLTWRRFHSPLEALRRRANELELSPTSVP